jgi:hypothetical protein
MSEFYHRHYILGGKVPFILLSTHERVDNFSFNLPIKQIENVRTMKKTHRIYMY